MLPLTHEWSELSPRQTFGPIVKGEPMDNVNWTDILQTGAILVALVFTGCEMRSRVRELKFRNYLDAISGHVDLAKLLVENPHLHAIYDYSPIDWTKKSYGDLSTDEKAQVHYCDQIIALCETVWVAEREKWLVDEWGYWRSWTDQLNKSPAFRWTLGWVRKDYDPKYLSAIRLVRKTPAWDEIWREDEPE